MASNKRGLNRDHIARTAVELLDESGLDGLTTRRLAEKLGVRSPTLYWHVRDKAALLDLVAEAICADAFEIDDTQPWTEQLGQGMRQFRSMLLAHRDAARLLRMRPPVGRHRLGHIDTTLRILLGAGFDEDEAAAISRLLVSHVISSIEMESMAVSGEAPPWLADVPEDLPSLKRVAPALAGLTGQRLFELGVEVIIDGLKARLAGRSGAETPTQGATGHADDRAVDGSSPL